MPTPKILSLVAFSGALAVIVGCSSLKSTMLTRDESNSSWQSIKTCGVPITLRVSTHLRVQINEKRYLTPKMGATAAENTWTPLTDPQGCPIVSVSWQHDFIKTDKIFTVDFKRPAAGTIDFSATFQDQYMTNIASKIEDKTIADVSNAIQGILKASRRTGVTGDAVAGAGPELREVDSVRAIAVFELDDPTWELQLAQFLDTYLTSAPTSLDGSVDDHAGRRVFHPAPVNVERHEPAGLPPIPAARRNDRVARPELRISNAQSDAVAK